MFFCNVILRHDLYFPSSLKHGSQNKNNLLLECKYIGLFASTFYNIPKFCLFVPVYMDASHNSFLVPKIILGNGFIKFVSFKDVQKLGYQSNVHT